MTIRPTARGIALGAVGLALALAGLGAGSTNLARIGLLAVVATLGALGYAWLTDPARGSHSLTVERSVTPDPVVTGRRAVARVTVRATGLGERIRLAGLRLGEQAAVELSGGRPLRARVERTAEAVTVAYPVYATRRGRWELGPLDVRHADPLGLVTTRSALGSTLSVTVWPAVTELRVPSDSLVAEADRVALGARSPSTDDAALRDYRQGDDLRRVHWRSTARLGDLVVRSDERAGMRAAAVLLDMPSATEDAEWSVSLAASVALALLAADHPVRLAGGRAPSSTIDPAARERHLRDSGKTTRATLLDLTVDLEPGPTPADSEADLVAAAGSLDHHGTSNDLVFAVLGPLGPAGRAALAPIGESSDAWAFVRTGAPDSPHAAAAHDTIAELRRAGWHAAPVTVGEPHEAAWARLVGELA